MRFRRLVSVEPRFFRDVGAYLAHLRKAERITRKIDRLRLRVESPSGTKRERDDLLAALDELQGAYACYEKRVGGALTSEIARTQIVLLKKTGQEDQMSDTNTGHLVHQLAAATAEIVALKKENAALGVKMRALQWKIVALEEAAERRFWAGFDTKIADLRWIRMEFSGDTSVYTTEEARRGDLRSLDILARHHMWRGEPWGCA